MVAALNDCDGLVAPTPEGAFYIFVDCSGAIGKQTADGRQIQSDSDFCAALLKDQAVAAVCLLYTSPSPRDA